MRNDGSLVLGLGSIVERDCGYVLEIELITCAGGRGFDRLPLAG